MLLRTAGEAGLAEDYLLVDGARHQFHCAGVGLVVGFQCGDVLLDMGLGCWSECYLELLEAVAENIVEFIGSKVLEYQGMVKLVDSSIGHLLGNGLVGSIEFGQDEGTFSAYLDGEFLKFQFYVLNETVVVRC